MNEGLDNFTEIENLKDTIIEYEELSNKVKQLEEQMVKLEKVMNSCISYVLKNQNDRYQTNAEKRMEYKEHEEFISGGSE